MKKIVCLCLALCIIFTSASVFAENKITFVTDRGTAYSRADFGEMPLKRYATISEGVVKEYRADYTFEKTLLNAKIETDIKEETDGIITQYDKDGKLIKVENATIKGNTTVKLDQDVARAKGYVWQNDKIVSLGDSDATKPKKINVFLIGSSSAFNWPVRYYPGEGYGKFLADYFNPDYVNFVNNAVSGASSTTYLDDNKGLGYWPATRDAIKPGDYVIIEVGGNDPKHTKDENGNFSPEKYKENLMIMHKDVTDRGGIVIYVAASAPAVNINNKGRLLPESSRAELAVYRKEIAQETNSVYIDCVQEVFDYLNSKLDDKTFKSIEDLQGYYYRNRDWMMKPEAEGGFGLSYEDTLVPDNFEADKESDYVHTNLRGADLVARHLYEALMESDSPLKFYTK